MVHLLLHCPLPLAFVSCRGSKIWKAALLCVMLAIWRECNSRTFEGVEQFSHAIKRSMLRCLYEWMTALGSIHSFHFLDFKDSLNMRNYFYFIKEKKGSFHLVFSLVRILWVSLKTVVELACWSSCFGRCWSTHNFKHYFLCFSW